MQLTQVKKGARGRMGRFQKHCGRRQQCWNLSGFPSLDMRMRWQGNRLEFQVYQKENQLLKYIDKQSTHHPLTFRPTTTSVLTWEIWEKTNGRLVEKKKKQRDSRITSFVIGYNQIICKAEIPKLLKQLQVEVATYIYGV
eukprot:7506394-Ditylum_brightwellii.AAC.1